MVKRTTKYSYAVEKKKRVEKGQKRKEKKSTTTPQKAASKKETWQRFEKLRKKKAPKKCNFEFTFNVKKALKGTGLKKRAPRSVREIKKHIRSVFGVSELKIHPDLNQFLHSKGIRNPPKKIRIELQRKPSEDEKKKGKYFGLVNYKLCSEFSELKSLRLEEAKEKKE
jgi:large subunit ribosomal protein L31e